MPGEIVGNVSIKVRPDTSKFSDELRAQLKKVKDDFEVDVGLNTKGALAEFKALKKQIQGDDIQANVKLNTRSLATAAGFRAPLAGIAKIFFAMQRNLEASARSSTRLARGLIAARRASIGAVADTFRWAGHMARVVLAVENARRAWQGLSKGFSMVATGIRKIPELAGLARHLADLALIGGYIRGIRLLNFAKSLTKIQTYANAGRRAMAGLNNATDRLAIGLYRLRNIRLGDVVNGVRRLGQSVTRASRSVSRGVGVMIDSGIRGIGKMFSSAFEGMASIAGKVANGFAKMSRGMVIFVAIAIIAAPLVGLIAGLIAGLPSLLAAAGAGFAAIALGLDGIKAAAKTLQPEVDALKAALSERWQSGLTPVFEQLRGIFPVLQDGLLAVTDGLVDMARGFTDVVTSVPGMDALRVILEGIGRFFSGIRPMVANLTSAFLQLAAAGAQNFGFLIDVLNKFGAAFADMVSRITGTTAFADAMRGMAQVLDALMQGFIKLMEAGMTAMAQLGGPLSTFINGLIDAFVALMPILTAVSGLIFEVLGVALKALVPIFEALTPVIQEMANVLGPILSAAIQALVPILQPLAEMLSTLLLAALEAIMPLLQPLADLFLTLGNTLGGVFTEVMIALTPLIQILADTLKQIVEALAPLLPAFGELAMAILPPLMEILKILVPLIADLAKAVLPILVEIVKAAVPIILMLVEAFKEILPPIIDFVAQIVEAMMPVMRSLLELIEEVWPSIRDIIKAAMKVIEGVIDLVLGIITGDWERAWDGLKDILEGAWDLIVAAIKGAIRLVIGIVKTIPGAILRAIGNLGRLLWNAGRSLLIGLWNGIASWVGELWKRVRGVVQGIRDFFPFSPAKTGPFSGKGYTTHSGRALIKDWAKGIEDAAPYAVRAVEDVMKSANRMASSEWNAHVSSEGFGDLGTQVADAMSGMSFTLDDKGGKVMAKVVNRENRLGNRR